MRNQCSQIFVSYCSIFGMSVHYLGSDEQGAFGLYFAEAALNLATSSAGIRPRSLTSIPCALAHSRTSVVFGPLDWALWDGRRAVPADRRTGADVTR